MGIMAVLIVIAGGLGALTLVAYLKKSDTETQVAQTQDAEWWSNVYRALSFMLCIALMAILLTVVADYQGGIMPGAPGSQTGSLDGPDNGLVPEVLRGR